LALKSVGPQTTDCVEKGSGQIGIELPSGVRLTVDASVDAEALSRVIGVLAR
jgi:transposase